MADFSDLYTDVMDGLNRPVTETTVLAACKKRINDGIRLIQRRRAYRKTERLVTVTYPASTLMIDLTAVCEGKLRDLICVQVLGDSSANGGTILPYKSYAQLQAARMKYQTLNMPANLNEWQYITEFFGHENFTTRVHRYYVFLMNGQVGLYPTPASDVNLLVFAHTWLPDLVNDTDTNFLLDWAYDLVHDYALHRMSVYLKQDNRTPLTKEEFIAGLEALDLLDSQMSENYITKQE